MSGAYFGEWKCFDDMARDHWDTPPVNVDPAHVLVACYDRGGYDGQAFILLGVGGVLMQVDSGHCSCNGLDWAPEIANAAQLRMQFKSGNSYHGDEVGAAVLAALDAFEATK